MAKLWKTWCKKVGPVVGAILLACAITPAAAGQRTASVSVSATVLASCRVDASSQVASASYAGLSQNSRCSGTTKPATRAVMETERPQLAKVSYQSSQEFNVVGPDGAQSAWVRLDVIY